MKGFLSQIVTDHVMNVFFVFNQGYDISRRKNENIILIDTEGIMQGEEGCVKQSTCNAILTRLSLHSSPSQVSSMISKRATLTQMNEENSQF